MRRLLLMALALSMPTCQWVPLTAPAGSTIAVSANPTFVPTNGGVSLITAFVTRSDGIPVSDGTVVYCFTSLGHVDEQIKTGGGIAHGNFVSDSHSGTANVTCGSGGPAQAPGTTTPGTTPGTTPSPSPSASPTPTPSPTPGGGGTGGTGGTMTGNVATILVGNTNAKLILVSIDPQKIEQGRPATVEAHVFDGDGNPIQNVPVFFSIPSPSGLEGLASQGTAQFTDANGEAFDTVFTKDSPGNPARPVTIVATTANDVSGSTTVVVN